MKLGDLAGFTVNARNGQLLLVCVQCEWSNADKPERWTLLELAHDALWHIREDQCPR